LPTRATIGAYFLVNIGISKTFELHDIALAKTVKFAFNADNLTNKYYFNEGFTDFDFNGNAFIRAVPGAPRSFSGSIVVGF
jgi:outer membrane receptor protein involved in Fe transport